MQQVIGATTTPINNNNHHQENNNSIRRLPFRRHNLFLPPPQQHQQEDQDSTINDEFSQFGSVFDELQAMMDAFASQFSPLKEQYDNNDEESVGSYRKRKYKQFEDVPGSHNHHNNSNGKSATSSISQFDAHQRMMLTLKDKLENMGATVFLPNSNTITTQDKDKALDWGILAGYDKEKRMIEDTMLLPLQHGHVYDEIRAGTRSTNTDDVSTGGTNYNNSNNIESSSSMSSSRARAVLLEGPPGCGKTTAARVIASQASVPLIYIPLEAIASKWYGETEKKLASILKLCESFPAAAAARGGGGCIVFIDELDALATTRGGGDMHEATRRVLGVLLRHLDGFEGRKGSIVVGATNRKQDLDPALRSRFSATIEFPLPDELGRKGIIAKYAKHLKESELDELARVTDGMSGRDLRDVAEIAERAWASKVIRGKEERGRLPPMGEYLEAMNLGMRK
jgi:SpoVK/Ycf46/Vps4 family AAA+-type ATPase